MVKTALSSLFESNITMMNVINDYRSVPCITLPIVSSVQKITPLSTPTAVVELIVSLLIRLCTIMVLVPVAMFLSHSSQGSQPGFETAKPTLLH